MGTAEVQILRKPTENERKAGKPTENERAPQSVNEKEKRILPHIAQRKNHDIL